MAKVDTLESIMRWSIAVSFLALIQACTTASGSLNSGTMPEVGQSKDEIQIAYVLASGSENPFQCRCSQFFQDVGIEILPNKNRTHFAVFTDVSRPYSRYSRVGNGRYYGGYDTYESAYALVENERRQKQEAIAFEEAQRVEERRKAEARAARQKEEEAAERREREQQKQLRIAAQKEAAERARKALLAKKPITCTQLIRAINANEARARRDYPQKDIRLVGIATDINVGSRPEISYTGLYYQAEYAYVNIEEKEDLLNGCVADMSSLNQASYLNKGEKFEFLCDSWDEKLGNVTFDGCQPFQNAVK
ncbi:hypothetical protein OAR53_03575 [Luminiphilus sp.]|nr:hypothetical protein [Luminiphilus sp.]